MNAYRRSRRTAASGFHERMGWVKKHFSRILLFLVIPAGLLFSLVSLFSHKDVYFNIQEMIEHNEFKRVEKLTRKLHKINPSDVRALRLMGLNYYLQGLKFDHQQGVRIDRKSRYRTDHFRSSQEEEGWSYYKKAVESMKKAVLADSKGLINSRDYMIIGFSYSRWGDSHFDRALEYLDKSEKMNRKDRVLSESDMPAFSLESLYRQKGYIHYRTGKYSNAMRNFLQANAIDRKVLNYLYLGHCTRALDMTNAAVKYYKLVIDYSRDRTIQSGCLEMLGGIYLHGRDYQKAETCFRRAVAINSNSATSYFGLSMVAEARGNRKQAKKYWALTLKADPHYGPAILRMRNNKLQKKKG